MNTVGIGLFGCGRIGRLHAELLARGVEGLRLVAVCDAVGAAAEALGNELGVAAADSPAALLGRADVDAVAICSTTDSHVELLVEAAAAGVPAFVEKPVSLSLAEIDRAINAVARSGTAVQVGFNRRFDPSHRAVADAVRAGDVGDLHLLRITSRDPAPPPVEYLAGSGGIFADMTIHDFDMARYVAGAEVERVYATGAVRVDAAFADYGDWDTAVIVLTHTDGTITTIDNSREAVYGYDQRVEAFGSGGAVASQNPPEHAAVRYQRGGVSTAPMPWFFTERYAEAYRAEWTAFAKVVDGAPSPVTLADGRACAVIAEAATRSARERRPVDITEIEP